MEVGIPPRWGGIAEEEVDPSEGRIPLHYRDSQIDDYRIPLLLLGIPLLGILLEGDHRSSAEGEERIYL